MKPAERNPIGIQRCRRPSPRRHPRAGPPTHISGQLRAAAREAGRAPAPVCCAAPQPLHRRQMPRAALAVSRAVPPLPAPRSAAVHHLLVPAHQDLLAYQDLDPTRDVGPSLAHNSMARLSIARHRALEPAHSSSPPRLSRCGFVLRPISSAGHQVLTTGIENSQMPDASPNRFARAPSGMRLELSPQGGECTRMPPTNAAAVASQPNLSPSWSRKPRLGAVRLTSPLHAAAFRQACLPPWLNHVKTHCALFDEIVIFFRNR